MRLIISRNPAIQVEQLDSKQLRTKPFNPAIVVNSLHLTKLSIRQGHASSHHAGGMAASPPCSPRVAQLIQAVAPLA
jgi:hypothetical protein